MSNEEILADRIEQHIKSERNEPILLNTDELILCMLALRLQLIDIDNASGDETDDVCEWRLCDEEANVYDTSCRNPHILINGTPEENNYKFCPYCGKKIKVVK